jgi:hypothetical protein
MYHYVDIEIVMRDCDSIEDAREKCSRLLPYHPDEHTRHMESWEITEIREAKPQVLAP